MKNELTDVLAEFRADRRNGMTPNRAMQPTVTSGLRPPVPAADGDR